MTRPGPDTVTPQQSGGVSAAARPGRPSWAASGATAAIDKAREFDDIERRHGLPVNQATENERLEHARQLLDSVGRAIDNADPYTERMVALAAHATRWADYLHAKTSQAPTTPPGRAPSPDLVRESLRRHGTPR